MRREQEVNFGSKTVAQILLGDAEERNKILEGTSDSKMTDHIYETIAEHEDEMVEASPARNDSSISSVSQLLEDPSPVSWAFASPLNDLEGEFTLKRQRGIRRKRPRKDGDKEIDGKRAKRTCNPTAKEEDQQNTLMEAINPNVKKLALETDLDSTLDEKHVLPTKISFCGVEERGKDASRKISSWDLDSPKSSVTDSSKSFVTSMSTTPEVPLVATVRRCLKFSPEFEPPARSINCRGSIEIECSLVAEHIHVRGE